VLPYRRGLRPAWLLRLGLFIYDHLGSRKRLPPARRLNLARDPAGAALKPGTFRIGFAFSDCRGDDARLTILNARDAADHGAVICTRTKVAAAMRRDVPLEHRRRGSSDRPARRHRGARARQTPRARGSKKRWPRVSVPG